MQILLCSWGFKARLCMWLLLIASGAAASIRVLAGESDGKIHIPVHVQSSRLEEPADYFTNLLILALEASKAENEVIDIVFSEHEYSQARWIHVLKNDRHRNLVIWTMTDKKREQQLRPIRIPLFKGLFGYRVLLIRTGEQARFDGIQQLGELAKLLAGQGTHWPDTDVMLHNGLRVTTSETTESLFRMLSAGRFDYFPRGISEAWFELAQRNEKGLVVEQNLLLHYPTAIYYFVNQENEALARRIESGLETLIDNGQFDQFFYHHPRISSGLDKLHGRTILTLENPDLPEALPLNHPRYWINTRALLAPEKPAAPQSGPGR